jgi:hypothetical protein
VSPSGLLETGLSATLCCESFSGCLEPGTVCDDLRRRDGARRVLIYTGKKRFAKLSPEIISFICYSTHRKANGKDMRDERAESRGR